MDIAIARLIMILLACSLVTAVITSIIYPGDYRRKVLIDRDYVALAVLATICWHRYFDAARYGCSGPKYAGTAWYRYRAHHGNAKFYRIIGIFSIEPLITTLYI